MKTDSKYDLLVAFMGGALIMLAIFTSFKDKDDDEPAMNIASFDLFNRSFWQGIYLANSPIYVEHCTEIPLEAGKNKYRWFCTGDWEMPGPCRSKKRKDVDNNIHTLCIQCYGQDEDGLWDRMVCPVRDVDKLLEITGQEVISNYVIKDGEKSE